MNQGLQKKKKADSFKKNPIRLLRKQQKQRTKQNKKENGGNNEI